MAEALKIDLDDETQARLETLRLHRNVSTEDLVRSAVADFLAREEEADREYAEDVARIAEYEKTGHAIPNKDVMEWLRRLGTDDEIPCPR